MFRHVHMKVRLAFSGFVCIFAVLVLSVSAIYSLWQSDLELERQIKLAKALKFEMTLERMHDVVHADALYAVALGDVASSEVRTRVTEKIKADIAEMEAALQDLSLLQVGGDLKPLIANVSVHLAPFEQASLALVDAAFSGGDVALGDIPKVEALVGELEKELVPLGEAVVRISSQSAEEARAHDQNLLIGNVGFALAMIVVMLMNVRNITLSITKPIERLRAALKEVAEGDFGLKIADIMRNDDFGDIARDIDAVSGRVMDALEVQAEQRREGERTILRLRDGLQRLSQGDLGDRIEKPFTETYDPLRIHYNETVDRLNELVTEVVKATRTIREQSDRISTDSQSLSSRTESQAATLEETAAALEQMTASVKLSAENAQKIEGAVASARSEVERSGQVVRGAVSAMDEIATSSGKISQIISVIDDIAFQTGLLALNAGVEAARAGEVGRGFAVVASEVRVLAQRASAAANEIKELISESATHVQEGVTRVNSTGAALGDVVTHVTRIAELMSGISNEASEQAQGINEVNIGVSQLDQVTQENVSMVETSDMAIQGMNRETIRLADLVGQFKLRSEEHREDDLWLEHEAHSGGPKLLSA